MIFLRDFVPASTVLRHPDPFQRAQGRLHSGDSLFSATRAFKLSMQDDGNLVLYVITDQDLPRDITQATYDRALWSSETVGQGGTHCDMQDDGNCVLYTDASRALWNSGTEGHPGAFLRCQSDGNLVWYTLDGVVIASTGTDAGPYGPGGEHFGNKQ